jgi:hypothetical protein
MLNKNLPVGLHHLAYECLTMKRVLNPVVSLKFLYEQKMSELKELMKSQSINAYQIEGTNQEVRIYRDGIGIVRVEEPEYVAIPDHDCHAGPESGCDCSSGPIVNGIMRDT